MPGVLGGPAAVGLVRRVPQPPASELSLATGEYGEFEGAEHDRVVFGTYRATGAWSRDVVSLLAERVFGGGAGTLLDAGANIGLVSIPVAERSAAHCLAFEPAPDNARALRRNVARHGLSQRVEVHALALDAHAGHARLALSADNSGDHRLAHGPLPVGRRCVDVPTARLDDVLAGRRLTHPLVLKLDTQGAEVRVLRGATTTLTQVDVLVTEYWPAGLARMGDDAAALQELLAQFPYAALLDQRTPPARLEPSHSVLHALRCLLDGRADEGFFDLVLAREARI